LKSSRNLPFHTRRDAWVEINLGAIEHNAAQVRSFLPESTELMAVIKADAYGHGAVMVLPTLEASGVSMLGVAAMDEALQIREAGIHLPILLLGITPDWAMHDAVENDVQLTVFSKLHLESLERLYEASHIPAKVQIKVDTGMHRIGVPWDKAADFIDHCQTLPFVEVKGVFSHLACTNDAVFTQLQMDRWDLLLKTLKNPPPLTHLANSSGVWHYPDIPNTMARVGLSLFGYPGDNLPLPLPIKPAMGLKARIVHLAELPVGEGVSYNQTYRNHSSGIRRIATLPLGYADGIPRNLSNQIEGLYHGCRIPQVGNITMDQLMMDVTDAPDAQVGDVITLLGSSQAGTITLTDWAKILHTIEYELMCALRVRLPKTYVR
jgi:alanine racemase